MDASIPITYQVDETIEQVANRLANIGLKLSNRFNGHFSAIQCEGRSLESRVESAKQILGSAFIGHPEYRFNPRHSNNPEVYVAARSGFLAQIAMTAQTDREMNPAFIRANAIRNLHAGA